MAINNVADLYRDILGREPDAEGLAFWQQGFGDTVDPNEIASFTQAAQSELANRPAAEQVLLAPKIVDTTATGVTDADILGWFNENPGADDATIARVMKEAAVTPDQVARATGSNYADVNNRYLAATAANNTNTFTDNITSGTSTTQDDLLSTLAGDNTTTTDTTTANTPTAVANPLIKLYEDTLGRTPTQEEIDSWGFGETIDAGELDRFLGAARNEAVTTQPTTGAAGHIASQILAQGTTQYWGGEGYGSTTQNAYDMGVLLAGQGFTDINQLGKVTKEVPTYSTDENGNQIETGTQTITQFINKATGQPINTYYDKAAQNGPDIWGGTFAGEGSTAYGVKFTADGKPIFYSKYGGSSSDIADWGPILSLAAVIPSPIQPFAIAANAAIAIENDDILGGIAALAGLAGFSDVAAGARILKAADSGDPFAIVSSIMNSPFAGDVGGTMLTDTISLRDAGNAVSVFNNVQNENWAGALTAANQLVNSPDLATAAAAARFINAFEKNNFAGMYTAASGFTNAMNAANKVTDKDVALNITNALADANSAATEGTQLASLGADTTASAGTDGDVTLPSGVQLASAGDGVFRTEVGGAPIFAESKNAGSVKAPLGYSLLSTTEADEKPAGSYYDITANAWFKPDEAITNLTGSSNLQSDIDLFTSSQGDLDKIAATTESTSDDAAADFLASIGITNTTQLADSGLSNQDILDMIGAGDTTGGTGPGGTGPGGTGGNITDTTGLDTGDVIPDGTGGTTGETKDDDKKPLDCPDGYAPNEEGTACIPVTTIIGPREECPVGTRLNPETGDCDPYWDEGGGEVCGVGERLDPETGMCVPVEVDTTECAEGFHLENGICVADTDTKEDTECPEGYVRNLETGQCEKVDTKTCPTGYTLKDGKCVKDTVTPPPPPKKCPTGYQNVGGVCVPIKKVVPPIVPTGYLPSGASGPGERTDPIYAGAMDDFDLFATLEELLKENPDKKKDNKKSKDKTKMATGGHLDDLLAEQMTVDDLLKLLR